MITLSQMWAKTEPFQSVITHGIISGTIAGELYENYLSRGSRKKLAESLSLSDKDTAAFLSYLVSLHDIGKIEEHFQRKYDSMSEILRGEGLNNSAPCSDVRHEKTGRDFLREYWKSNGLERRTATAYSDIIGAHHQGKGCISKYDPNATVWNELREEYENMMRNRFWGSTVKSLPLATHANRGASSAILLGCMILSDWISSSEVFSEAESWIFCDESERRIKAIGEKFLKDSGLIPGNTDWPNSFCSVWPFITEETLRPLQIEVEKLFENSRQRISALLIEAPMGEGKTEAGVFAALQMMRQWNKDGFYMALPTSATSNQMVWRLRELISMNGKSDLIRLLHAVAWLVDEQTLEERFNVSGESSEVHRWLAPIKRGLLGQYAVGTIDQAMIAATIAKYGVLRLLGLANKVLIIDEIHSYDVYMSAIIGRLLEWCRELEIPVVLLSATLPPKHKERLLAPFSPIKLSNSYPLLTATYEDETVTERAVTQTSRAQTVSVSVEPILNNPDKIAFLAHKMVENGGCICVLMNTVNEAQRVYTALKNCYSGDLHLFHARFPAAARTTREQECLSLYGKDKSNRPKQSILVATQVVEQSLDVDFDAMLTAVAPIDLILQRMGRIFRHENTLRPDSMSEPKLCILMPESGGGFGSSKYVYSECLLRQSVNLLQNRESIRIPEDLAPLVAAGYDEAVAPSEDAEKWIAQYYQESVEKGAAEQYLLSPPDKKLSTLGDCILLPDEEQKAISVKTRLGEPTVTLVLAEPKMMMKIEPFIVKKGDILTAAVNDRTLAKELLSNSFSMRESQLRLKSNLLYITGDTLISGIKILPAENGMAKIESGLICYDSELGVIIKEEGEL